MRKILRALLVLIGLVGVGVAIRYATTSASNDRDWVPDQSRTASITKPTGA